MAIINKLTTYNAPFEFNSADRFVEDVDNKLSGYKIEDVDVENFGINGSSTTQMSITITGKRASYMRIESSIFIGQQVSYWFLDSVNTLESDEATTYSAKIDVFATFGETLLNSLDGVNMKIERAHEDRFNYENFGFFGLNVENHGLINSDFNLGDTKGQSLLFKGANETETTSDPSYVMKHVQGGNISFIVDKLANDTSVEGIEEGAYGEYDIVINNIVEENGRKYYLYAVVNIDGAPFINDGDSYFIDSSNKLTGFLNDVISTNRAIRNSVLVPVSIDLYGPNTIHNISKLQEDKVLNIIKIPYKIDGDVFQILFNEKGERITGEGAESRGDLYKRTGEYSGEETNGNYLIRRDYNSIPKNNLELLYEVFGLREIKSYKNNIKIPVNGLKDTLIFDTYGYAFNVAEMKDIVDKREIEKLEIGLLNSSISPITLHFGDNDVILDIYNFYKTNSGDFIGEYSINEMGIETSIKINDNQFTQWSENTIMSFNSDQGATFLARNKYSIDAQKKGIDINKTLSKNNIKLGQSGQYGGGVTGSLFSLLNPANWASSGIRGQQNDIQNDIASNKKSQINATISDSSSTSPSTHTGSDHNLANLNTTEYKYDFNWSMKKPNRILRNSIIKYYERHGYLFNDWVEFSDKLWKSRDKYNYLQIKDFLDYSRTVGNFDISILSEISDELLKGVRIWHGPTIEYNSDNIEKTILDNI